MPRRAPCFRQRSVEVADQLGVRRTEPADPRDRARLLYVTGTGHGGPALVANAYLESPNFEVCPHVNEDLPGLTTLVRQFSSRGGIPSHVSVQTPGSIHEGGDSAMPWSMRLALRSTIQTCSLPASSTTVKPSRAAFRLVEDPGLPQPRRGRGGASDPATQRVNDRGPHGPVTHQRRARTRWKTCGARTTRCRHAAAPARRRHNPITRRRAPAQLPLCRDRRRASDPHHSS